MTNARELIFAAFPRYPAAHLESTVGCTRRQAWRMVSTGRIPAALRERALDVIFCAIKAQKAHLAALEAQEKVLAYAEMVATGADRHREMGASAVGTPSGLAEGATQLALIDTEAA